MKLKDDKRCLIIKGKEGNHPLCVSCRIDNWQIVYLAYRIRVPVLQYKLIKVRLRYIDVPMDSRGQLPVASLFR